MQLNRNYINASKISVTTFIFLTVAPIILIWYALYIYNFKNIDNIFLYTIQIIADTISIVILLGLWMTILIDVVIEKHHRSKFEKYKEKQFMESLPSIDVFITTYKEPIDIIRKTASAAKNIRYPHRTIILDDGKSDEIRDLALNELGIGYIRRPKNQNAKAGNINYALEHVDSDFFAILDADHVPRENFLDVLLPYLSDEKVAMAQSPQVFSNQNFVAEGTSQAQAVFYKYICPAKNVTNSAFSVGTNVLYRRKAIDDVGGIALSNSEDIWTAFLLHQKKWKTVFVNKIVAVGLAPDSIIAFFKQQRRWAKGGFEILLENNPLYSDKLELDQKIQYFISNSFFLVGITILVYILMPIVFLLTGEKPLLIVSGAEWLLHYLPYFFLYFTLTWLLLGQKMKLSTISTALATFYPYILGLLSVVFHTEQEWVATSSTASKIDPVMKWIWPHIFLLFLSIFSLIVGWYKVVEFWPIFFNTIWVLLNVFLLVTFLTKAKLK